MSGIRIRRNFDLPREIPEALSLVPFNVIGLRAIQTIQDKTKSGVDFQNHPFQPYSDFYKEIREQKGLRTDRVDLIVTNNMLSGMTANSDESGVVIGFLDGEQSNKAFSHVTGKGSLPNRDFFFIDDDDVDEILEIAMNFVDKAL